MEKSGSNPLVTVIIPTHNGERRGYLRAAVESCLAQTYVPDHLRLLYRSTELGIYHIRIFADVQSVLKDGHVLHVQPVDSLPPVQVGGGLFDLSPMAALLLLWVFERVLIAVLLGLAR